MIKIDIGHQSKDYLRCDPGALTTQTLPSSGLAMLILRQGLGEPVNANKPARGELG